MVSYTMFCLRISGPESGKPPSLKVVDLRCKEREVVPDVNINKGDIPGDKACRDPLQISSNNGSIQPSIWQLSSNRSRILT